jgi:hypothetical protein
MHLLRDGHFEVYEIFMREIKKESKRQMDQEAMNEWEEKTMSFYDHFRDMYEILDEMKCWNLDPAIAWAQQNSHALESRGSNLAFTLATLRFSQLFAGGTDLLTCPAPTDEIPQRIVDAAGYLREAFSKFLPRHASQIYELVGALAYWQNVTESPYAHHFQLDTAWDEARTFFTKEFCSLLGLSASSPLYIACTAGAIALPILSKVKKIMETRRTEWTTEDELPVEIPLPAEFQFHSIFVCPVSKEQATAQNPPMMLPCGHVICAQTLEKICNKERFKCPYCPVESNQRDARKVYL